jgi:hypothetical protein
MTLNDTRRRTTPCGAPRPGNREDRVVQNCDLVDRAQAGDGESFGLLSDRHVDAVYGYIHSRLLDHRSAEIICSETFFHAVRELSSITGGEPEFGDRLLATAGSLVDFQLRAAATAE